MSITIHASVMKGIAFIENNLYNDISVYDVANSVSYSQFYFSREFSKHTHISIYDYILRRKISESYKLLFATNSKIVDLAFQYGFKSHEVYTRAFRKVFGENPSEAVVYKPLAVYEQINEPYLDFLNGLKVEVAGNAVPDRFFEVNSAAQLDDGNNFLILLAKNNLQSCCSILNGNPSYNENKFLSFPLRNLKHKIRIYHTDAKLSFRYFIDYFFDIDELGNNFILIQKEKNYIDFIIPSNHF